MTTTRRLMDELAAGINAGERLNDVPPVEGDTLDGLELTLYTLSLSIWARYDKTTDSLIPEA